MKSVVISSHVTLVDNKEYDGIGNVLKTTLGPLVDEYYFVRNSMEGGLKSEVQVYKAGKITKTINLHVPRSPSPLRYVAELFQTVRFFRRTKKRIDIYIGIDPLNALAGIVLKKLGVVRIVVFYTADYSPKRFESDLLNRTYHKVDRYCVRHADEVWSVSSKIVLLRKSMGLEDSKNIFVPNVPPIEYDELASAKNDRYELITMGIVDRQLDFIGTLEAIARLKNDMPKLRLKVIGNGPEEGRLAAYAKKLGILERVNFLGRLPLDETLAHVARSGIGLGLYTGVWGFNEYGDSTKCREFFNFGLPVISTDTHSTVDDIIQSQAGVIVKKDVDDYILAIRTVLDDYERYSKNASRLGQRYKGVHRKELSRLLAATHTT